MASNKVFPVQKQMNILNPATDNLYKVLTISFLALLVGSFIFVAQDSYSMRAQLLSFNIQKAAFEVDKNYVVDEIQQLESKAGKTPSEVSKLRKVKWDWEKREAQMNVRSQYYADLVKRNHKLTTVTIRLIEFIFLLIILTLIFWYQCLQKHLDEFAKNGVDFLSREDDQQETDKKKG